MKSGCGGRSPRPAARSPERGHDTQGPRTGLPNPRRPKLNPLLQPVAPCPAPSRCSPASGPICRSRNSPRWSNRWVMTASNSPVGAITSTSTGPPRTKPTSARSGRCSRTTASPATRCRATWSGRRCAIPSTRGTKPSCRRMSGATAIPRACGSARPRSSRWPPRPPGRFSMPGPAARAGMISPPSSTASPARASGIRSMRSRRPRRPTGTPVSRISRSASARSSTPSSRPT